VGDDNVQNMWQLLHTFSCPACGSPLALHVGDGALTVGAASTSPQPAAPHEPKAPGHAALEQAWARFVAAPAGLDD
jgi:hypothetical protein